MASKSLSPENQEKYKDNEMYQLQNEINRVKRIYGNDSNEVYVLVHKLARMFLQSRRNKTYIAKDEFEPFAADLAEKLVLQNMKKDHIDSWIGYMLVCYKSKLYLWRQEQYSNSISVDDMSGTTYRKHVDSDDYCRYEEYLYIIENLVKFIDYSIQFIFMYEKGTPEFIEVKNFILLQLILRKKFGIDLFQFKPVTSKKPLRYRVLLSEVLRHVSEKFN